MPKIDIAAVPERSGSGYPAPFHEPCMNRVRKALGDAGGLTQFGVNLLTLAPGAWSSQRHWHTAEDEFITVLSGEVVLIDDHGERLIPLVQVIRDIVPPALIFPAWGERFRGQFIRSFSTIECRSVFAPITSTPPNCSTFGAT